MDDINISFRYKRGTIKVALLLSPMLYLAESLRFFFRAAEIEADRKTDQSLCSSLKKKKTNTRNKSVMLRHVKVTPQRYGQLVIVEDYVRIQTVSHHERLARAPILTCGDMPNIQCTMFYVKC